MTDLATLQVELEALKRAFYSGALKVTYENKTVEYRTLSEMREAINSLEREINGGASGPVNVVMRPRQWW